jgi:hypothetical protein
MTNLLAGKNSKSPARVAAGKRNRLRRGALSPAGRQRLHDAALRDRPWELSTGPRTAAGKAAVANDGRKYQKGTTSVRQQRAAMSQAMAIVSKLRKLRKELARARSLI